MNKLLYLEREAHHPAKAGFHVGPLCRSNWNLEMLVFVEGGKPENPEKNPRSRGENEQQTQRTYDARSGPQTRATLVGDERSHQAGMPWSWLLPKMFIFLQICSSQLPLYRLTP